jgi:hypothetical protein
MKKTIITLMLFFIISNDSKANENQILMVCDNTVIYKFDKSEKVKKACKTKRYTGGATNIKTNKENIRTIIMYSILTKKNKKNKTIKFIFINDELQFLL